MNRKHAPIVLILCIAAAAAIIGIGAVLLTGNSYSKEHADLNDYYSLGDEDAAVLLNGELLEEKGKCRESSVYLPYDIVSSLPGNPFYYESSTGRLYLTLQNENNIWTADSDPDVMITDAGTVYVACSIVSEYSDAVIEEFSAPARVTIRTEFENISSASVTEDSALRCENSKKADITADLLSGDKLFLPKGEESDDNWIFAVTEDGITGYIESSMITLNDPETIEHETNKLTSFDKIKLNGKASLIWTYVDCQENNDEISMLLEGSSNIGILCPTWISLADKNGNITSLADSSYAAYAEKQGMQLWAMVSDYYGEETTTGEILSDPTARQNIINSLISQASSYNFDGINIDFETISEDEAPAFLQFLRELSVETHRMGIVLSVDNYVPGYTDHYNREEQAKIADYIVIMGYDEHTSSSEEPGSVASLTFVEQAVIDTMEEVPADQIILGVPFYTRTWTEPAGTDYFETSAVSMDDGYAFAEEHEIELVWSDTIGQYYGSSDDGTARYSIWIEDAKSLGEKLKLIDKYSLAGAAAWRLGFENLSVWSTWGEYLK